MLTAEQNELLTRVGPGTPMRQPDAPLLAPDRGGLRARRHHWTKRVRLLGEDLVLFKDRRAGSA